MDGSIRPNHGGRRDRVVVIGAGMGGLAAAVDLARRGAEVTVLERAATAGGKMRQVQAGGAGVDAGPTVFTMRWIFDGLFAEAGERLEDHVDLLAADILARHAWRGGDRPGSRLDLFADIGRSAEAIGDFAGAAEAQGYRDFVARGADIHRTLVGSFIAAERPSPLHSSTAWVGGSWMRCGAPRPGGRCGPPSASISATRGCGSCLAATQRIAAAPPSLRRRH